MSILCRFGFHKWSGTQMHHEFQSNVRECQKRCVRCGSVKRWNEPISD
jgi:hypothetical protein